MKELLSTIIVFVICSFSLNSQESVIEGKLGIGTFPLTTLHIGTSAGNSKLLLENAGDLQWKNSFGTIKNILTYHSDDNLYFDSENDLIFRSGPNERFRIFTDGRIKINSGKIELLNLGDIDNDGGLIFGEDENSAFGLVYDGEGTGSSNRIHFRKYLGGQTGDIMTLKGNGRIGIGISDPVNELDIGGSSSNGVAGFIRTDLGGNKSHILHGVNGDWFIRPSLSEGKIVIADHGGNVGIGTNDPLSTFQVDGKVNISDDNKSPNAGDIRFNSTRDDFEGYDGSDWYSLTNNKKKVYTLNIGAGEIMIDKNNQSDFDISLHNGYSTFTSFFSNTGHLYCPISLPVGSKIIEIRYNYRDSSPTDDISFELRRYNQSSSGHNTYYGFSSSNVSLSGFETETLIADHTIANDSYYAFIFTLRWTSGDYDQHKIQGVKVTYELP